MVLSQNSTKRIMASHVSPRSQQLPFLLSWLRGSPGSLSLSLSRPAICTRASDCLKQRRASRSEVEVYARRVNVVPSKEENGLERDESNEYKETHKESAITKHCRALRLRGQGR